MNERKNIIVSLKSSLGESPKGIKSRIRFLKILIIIYSSITLLFVGILTLSIISELFNTEIINWEKAGISAIISLVFSLNLPKQIFELKLLKHLMKINTKPDFDGITKLNNELKNIIDQLNNTLKTRWFVVLPVISTLIMAFWQFFSENNPYWDFMKIPFLLIYGILLTDFIITNRKLTKNINKVEKSCN